VRLVAEKKLRTVEAEQQHKVAIAVADDEEYAKLELASVQTQTLKIQNAALWQRKDMLERRRIEVERVKAGPWNGAPPTSIYSGAPMPFMSVWSQPEQPPHRPSGRLP
jgi:hypothetical protein